MERDVLTRGHMSRKLLVGSLIVSAAVLVVVFSWRKPDAVYARTVTEFLARPTPDQLVRIEGVLVRGSLCVRQEPCEYRFRLMDRRAAPGDAGTNTLGSQLFVHYPRCIVPDTLRDTLKYDVNVVVEGKQCKGCHFFQASEVFAKVPGKYEMKQRGWVEETPPFVPMHDCSGS